MTREVSGKLVSADGSVLYQNVRGTIHVTQGALKSWAGQLTIESGETPQLVQGFLITDDGGSGEVIVKRCSPFNSNVVEFQGTGPAPFEI